MVGVNIENDIVILDINIASLDFLNALEEVVSRYISVDAPYKGYIFTSSRQEFMTGIKLELFRDVESIEESNKMTQRLQSCLRAIERSGRPAVACINGDALGVGLELALACHHVIALKDPALKLGFPEVTFGLLPFGGGTQRLPRLIGFEAAIPILTQGNTFNPEEAHQIGIVHQLVQNENELLENAKSFIINKPSAVKAWDADKYRIPGPAVQSPKGYQFFPAASAMLMEKTWLNYPAPENILKCVYEGLQVPFDQSLLIEQRYFSHLLLSAETRNMIRTLFFSFNKCRKNSKTAKGTNILYNSRITSAYISEGINALNEGIPAALIENAGRAAGMKTGPLALADETGKYPKRFYNELDSTDLQNNYPLEEMKVRLLTCQVLESLKCLEDGVIESIEEADVNSVFDTGFPAYTGGPLSYIDYRGVDQFIDDCARLEKKFGERFNVPNSLLKQKKENKKFDP